MLVERAVKYFRGPEGYNCMQAVLKAFVEEDVGLYSKSGHGADATGKCGALLGALILCPHKQDVVESNFLEQAGSLLCREIRKLKKTSCKDCVALAAKIVCELRES